MDCRHETITTDVHRAQLPVCYLMFDLFFVQSFLMRRQYFNHEETGYFRKENQTVPNALSQMGGAFLKSMNSNCAGKIRDGEERSVWYQRSFYSPWRSFHGPGHDERDNH